MKEIEVKVFLPIKKHQLEFTEAIVLVEDGGVATFQHNGENITCDLYQNRTSISKLDSSNYDIWEDLGEGKMYCKDYEFNRIYPVMIDMACEWLYISTTENFKYNITYQYINEEYENLQEEMKKFLEKFE